MIYLEMLLKTVMKSVCIHLNIDVCMIFNIQIWKLLKKLVQQLLIEICVSNLNGLKKKQKCTENLYRFNEIKKLTTKSHSTISIKNIRFYKNKSIPIKQLEFLKIKTQNPEFMKT